MRKPNPRVGKQLSVNKITQLIVAELKPSILDPWLLHTSWMRPCRFVCPFFFILLKSKVCMSINILYFRILYLITQLFTCVFHSRSRCLQGNRQRKPEVEQWTGVGRDPLS